MENLRLRKNTPNKILHSIIDENKKDYVYIILGRPGATGKSWLCMGLKQYGFNAFEISEDIMNLVQYNREENHVIVNDFMKHVVIILNRLIERKEVNNEQFKKDPRG